MRDSNVLDRCPWPHIAHQVVRPLMLIGGARHGTVGAAVARKSKTPQNCCPRENRAGLSKEECEQMREVILREKLGAQAYCTPNKAPPVICPFAPPCWRDGKPIVGSL
jgi:hypothetical protein